MDCDKFYADEQFLNSFICSSGTTLQTTVKETATKYIGKYILVKKT